MNIFQPIKLTVVTPSAEVPILSQHKKRFYTYIPSAICMRLDKEAYQAMPRDKTGICMEWVPDYNVVEIQRCARIISNGLSIRNDSDFSNDKTLIDQVKLAIEVINMQLDNYTFVI